MAVYEFVCQSCGERFEITAPMRDYDHLKEQSPVCPKCGQAQARQRPSVFACKTPSAF